MISSVISFQPPSSENQIIWHRQRATVIPMNIIFNSYNGYFQTRFREMPKTFEHTLFARSKELFPQYTYTPFPSPTSFSVEITQEPFSFYLLQLRCVFGLKNMIYLEKEKKQVLVCNNIQMKALTMGNNERRTFFEQCNKVIV